MKILSYNVWFREDLELHKRMKAIGDLVQLHSPDLICFQVLFSLHFFCFLFSFCICVALFDFVELCSRKLLPIYMTFSSDPRGGMFIIVQFLWRRLIQDPTFVCW